MRKDGSLWIIFFLQNVLSIYPRFWKSMEKHSDHIVNKTERVQASTKAAHYLHVSRIYDLVIQHGDPDHP